MTDPYAWLHENEFSWDDTNAIAAILEAGGFDIYPVEVVEAALTDFIYVRGSDFDADEFPGMAHLRAISPMAKAIDEGRS